jgi:wyosine [tRNA(Phe)-imidazoG37] synthetase (radical SAM superfamily)
MEMMIPKIVQIETIFGCNASCVMCTIDMPTKREKGIMPMELFKKIVDDISPYHEIIKQIDLFGLGEPLLDRYLIKRIAYLKKQRMRGIGISTNAHYLNEEKQYLLLESGIDTIIFSIESIRKEIHERIRVNTEFERVIANANSLIQKRDKGDYPTKFVFRFIGQELNQGEWDAYQEYWDVRINRSKGDEINLYSAHTWVGEVKYKGARIKDSNVEKLECYQVFDRMMIFRDGTMSMCSCDLHHPYVCIGSVVHENVLVVYNNAMMRDIRNMHTSGDKYKIDICKKCNMLYAREEKQIA